MSKNVDVSRTLSKGGPRQRALLIANHITELERTGKGFLSPQELERLTDSFKSNKEIEIYNEINRQYKIAQNFLMNLSQIRLAYAEANVRLDRLVIIRKTNLEMEEMANMLTLLITDRSSRETAREMVANRYNNPALRRKFKTNGDGFIELAKNALSEIDEDIANLLETVKTEQVNLKTAIVAIRDYLDETGLSIKMFKSYVKSVETWAKSSAARGPHVREIKFERKRGGSHPLADKSPIEEDFNKVEVDPDLYEKYRKDFLNG